MTELQLGERSLKGMETMHFKRRVRRIVTDSSIPFGKNSPSVGANLLTTAFSEKTLWITSTYNQDFNVKAKQPYIISPKPQNEVKFKLCRKKRVTFS